MTQRKTTKKRRKNPTAKQLAARRKFALMAKQRAKVAKKRSTKQRNKTIIRKPKSVLVLNGKSVRRKYRNGYLDMVIRGQAKKTPEGWKVGKKTVAQGRGIAALSSGYYLDKATGTIFAKRVRNAAKKSSTKRRNKTIITKPKRVLVVNSKKKAVKKKTVTRRNSSAKAKEQRKEFAGKVGRDLNLYFPQKSLSGLSTLGPLVSLQGDFGTIKPTKGGVYYCQDSKGRIHIGATSANDLWAHVKENLGAVRRVEYRAAKPHLGYPQVVTWYHDFEAPYPVLKSDGKGGLAQVGGGYKIRREGIVG